LMLGLWRLNSTVILTVILTGIPKRSIHHQSTSIADRRRFHDGQLSRSIAVYRVLACDLPSASRPPAPSRKGQEDAGIKHPKLLSHRVFTAGFLPSLRFRTNAAPPPGRLSFSFPRISRPRQLPSALQ
jgi:hypothetical protein